MVALKTLEKSILMNSTRFDIEKYADEALGHTLRACVDICTMEHPIYRHPKLTPWNLFKYWFFPNWLKQQTPVLYTEVIAVHKFPEVEPPKQMLGREFVHVIQMDYDKFIKKYGVDAEREEAEVWENVEL